MKPEEVKVLKPGQTCLVRAKVQEVWTDNRVSFYLGAHLGTVAATLDPEAIHSVLPDPIKVGDRVRGLRHGCYLSGEVFGLRFDKAAIRWDDGSYSIGEVESLERLP